MSTPTLEAVIVTYHSVRGAPAEMNTIISLAEGHQDWHWTFVDNSESGEDAGVIEARLANVGDDRVKVLRRPDNLGFAGGVNLAARQSSADWIVLLNPDLAISSEVLDNIASACFAAPDRDSGIAFSQVTGTLRHCGVAFSAAGWFYDRHVDVNVRHSGSGNEVTLFGPSGGAAAYRRSTFLSLGGFDEAFHAWGEDAEFALRSWLAGERTLESYVDIPHIGGHSVGSLRVRRRRAHQLVRNRVIVAARLYGSRRLLLFFGFLGVVLIGKFPRMMRERTLIANLSGVASGLRQAPRARTSYKGSRW